MSGVDVLNGLRKFERTYMPCGLHEEAADMAAIFAAVAELIAALSDFDGMDRADSGATPRLARLRAAIANATGGAKS